MYRTICCEFWTDPDVARLTKDEILLVLYLITNPHSHMAGIYYLSMATMAEETKINIRGIEGGLKGLQRENVASYSEEFKQVWVINMLEYQGRGQNVEKGVAAHLMTLHKSPLIPHYLNRYPTVRQYLPSSFIGTPFEGVSKGDACFPSPVPDPSSVSVSVSDSDGEKSAEKRGNHEFDLFFAAYPDTCPRKVRKTALIAWKKANHIPLLDVMLAALESQKQSKQWLEEGGQFIPAPSRWINEERWNTKVPKKPMTTMEAFLARGDQDDTRGIRQGVVTLDHATVGQGVPDPGTGPGRH